MAPQIGFVLLTHNQPGQMLRLVRRLNALYENPPVACHHDFSKCSLSGFDFPRNVEFVQPSLDTKWGSISVVNAFRLALRALYERSDSPDWFVFLSGADYPVRSSRKVIEELSTGGFDAFLDHRLIEYPYDPDRAGEGPRVGFNHPAWVPTAYDRYIAIKFPVPGFSRVTIRSPFLLKPFHPFSSSFGCYGGDWWFCGNRKTAELLLARNAVNRLLLKYFNKRFIPEESVLHTILCNQPDLRISRDYKRFSAWDSGGHHPKVLGVEDIPRIIQSGAHFARKFDLALGPEVFDRIDEIVDK